MLYKRILALIVVIAVAVSCTGCFFGGGDKDKTASRGRSKKRKNAAQTNEEREVDPFTPEGSMRRDLAKMQERERQQTKLVAQLRESRSPDEARIQREEDKLFELRGRVQEYDVALQRYEMAARSRPPRVASGGPSQVPAEMFQDRPVRNQTAYEEDYRSYARAGQGSRGSMDGGYRTDPVVYQDDRMTHARLPLGYEQQNATMGRGAFQEEYLQEREEMLYNPMADGGDGYSAYDDGRTLVAPGSMPPAHMMGQNSRVQPGQKPFAGAPVGRARFPEPTARDRGMGEPAPWETGSMYSNRTPSGGSRQEVPNIYANRSTGGEETLWPAGTAMVAPSQSVTPPKQLKTTTVRLPENDLKPLPVAEAPVAPAPAKNMPSMEDFSDDDVFNPDMFLGR